MTKTFAMQRITGQEARSLVELFGLLGKLQVQDSRDGSVSVSVPEEDWEKIRETVVHFNKKLEGHPDVESIENTNSYLRYYS